MTTLQLSRVIHHCSRKTT